MSFVLTRLVSCHLGSDLGGWLERLAERLRFPFLKLEGGVLTKKLGEGLQHPQTELGWGRPQPARHSLPGTRAAPGLFFVPVALPFRVRSPPDPFQLVWQAGAWPCVAHPAPREVTVLGSHTSEYFSLPQAKSMRLFPVLGNCKHSCPCVCMSTCFYFTCVNAYTRDFWVWRVCLKCKELLAARHRGCGRLHPWQQSMRNPVSVLSRTGLVSVLFFLSSWSVVPHSFNLYFPMDYWCWSPSPMVLVVKKLPVNAGDARDADSIPWIRKIPWRRAWQPTPVFLPGESHGQSLADNSP